MRDRNARNARNAASGGFLRLPVINVDDEAHSSPRYPEEVSTNRPRRRAGQVELSADNPVNGLKKYLDEPRLRSQEVSSRSWGVAFYATSWQG